ncbi:hypothetical protein PFFVO_02962 [Plasmodium falciparum Vietnam Oak-Knoll (FVO)]|uniref:Uncharacterized protein n=1 Tax=Plasmodium falciparum Vietnam Oak-Knoll (FVO) TaxID=1036723 RepID=A0A024V6G2_PLAFA|nr:hypothetical protein PFFVO_02962 [Plasmodium falciparum Vietnam Oak-Knoll (FVO)]
MSYQILRQKQMEYIYSRRFLKKSLAYLIAYHLEEPKLKKRKNLEREKYNNKIKKKKKKKRKENKRKGKLTF